jgi:hypothetical protein
MKPRAHIVLCFLLLGAIVNVAVAWGLAYWANPKIHWTATDGRKGTQPERTTHGWPIHALADEVVFADGSSRQTHIVIGDGTLPFWPLLPGLVVNTLIYALVLFSLYCTAVVALRRTFRGRIRMSDGRCPKCGYDLRHAHSGGCPECGWGRPVESAVRGAGESSAR